MRDSLLPLQLFNTYKIDILFFVKAPQVHNHKKVVGKQGIKNRARDERKFLFESETELFCGRGGEIEATKTPTRLGWEFGRGVCCDVAHLSGFEPKAFRLGEAWGHYIRLPL